LCEYVNSSFIFIKKKIMSPGLKTELGFLSHHYSSGPCTGEWEVIFEG
jgi:hypothetical protein